MTRSLSRTQSSLLGLVVILCLGLGVWGLFRVAGKSGRFADGYEVTVLATDAQDVEPGTPVRVRGLEAGQVVAVEDTGEGVLLRLKLDGKYRDRIHADATASVQTKGILGISVIDVKPGTSAAGPLGDVAIQAKPTPDLAEVTAKLHAVAGRVDSILKEVEEGKGTLPMLLRDDTVYRDLKDTSARTKKLVENLDQSVTGLRSDAQSTLKKVDAGVEAVHGELDELKGLMRTGQEAVSAIKQDAEAIKAMPIVRSYVEDNVAALVRPTFDKDRVIYVPNDFFEPGTAILHDSGRHKLNECAAWLNGQHQKGSEIVVATFADPKDRTQTSASARTLTKKQSEAMVEYFKGQGVHKMGYVTRRKLTPVGNGQDPSPVVEKDPLPAGRIEVILFVPR